MKLITGVFAGLLFCSSPAFAKVNVFACEPEWKALVETLGGDKVKAVSATTAFQDPHYIEARPSLIAKTRRADLVVCTGAELEIGWLPLLLRQSGNANIQAGGVGYFTATSQVQLIEVPLVLDRSYGDVHADGNPHVHWDPYRLLTIAEALAKRLQTIDPDNAGNYQQNFAAFSQSWQQNIARWEAQAASLKGKKVIVYHKSWSYLLNWLGIEQLGDLEPKPGIPPTSAHLASLLKTVRATETDYILVANFRNDKGAKWLSAKTDVPALSLPYTVGGSKQATDLVSLYDAVLTALVDQH